MITLKGFKKELKGFLEDTSKYPSKPSKMEQEYIKFWEKEIETRSKDFLMNPQEHMEKWEELTDDEIPKKYTMEFSQVITAPVYGRIGEGVKSYIVELLPLIDAKGEVIEYPEDRLVANFLKHNQQVYVLSDEVLKELPVV